MRKTLLIADDSVFMRTWLKKMVDNSMFQVITEAKDGYEAVENYKKFNPDLVLLDITMPKVNGLTALKEIQKYDPKAKVIMCSALGQKSLIREALQCGAKDFIIKPYFDNLNSSLKNVE
jgi:two-component system, chemotaxis family, chemotaxis protein CheY